MHDSFTRRSLLVSGSAFAILRKMWPRAAHEMLSTGGRSMPAFRPKGAWKWDTILWDADRQVAGIGREFIRLGDASLALRVHWNDEQGYTNDVYSAHAGQFVIRSVDSGFTWQRYDDPVLDENQTRLRNGELVKVYSGGQAIEEKRELLHQVGANPDTASIEGNDLWPESMRAELEGKGYVVEKSFPGIIGTLTSLSCSISVDGGKTYIRRKIDLPPLARTYGSFRRCIELRDGTILAACCGRRKANSPEFNFVLRSVDQGRTWSFHVIADDGAARLQFNETEIHELPDRRILAMFRCHHMGESVGNYLYQSTSEDGGKSWTAFRRTPIWGYPPQLITLSSGAVLVTYAHRRHPFGVRACLSRNGGETWDYENEKIICDDSLPGLVQYPTSSQLDDGTILTAYAISKIPRIPYRPDDQVGPDTDLLIHRRQRIGKDQHWVGGYHGFAGLSRYTEDYIRAPGQTTSKTMYHGKGGNDEE